ncbi:hypothetical protein QBC35DRAFT_132042 [Podospora australis]|uniref:Polyketide synthase n=1 Tax=Podospora australis TaxID=1536484 RepID=A0AAN7ADB3_9PEZI|nr:hypothetical protein QBC35DRAFT_132042 [Podospora australis]
MGSLPEYDAPPAVQDGGILPPLAIIGMSFRFPQDAVNTAQFWKMMIEKRCASTPVPPDRFNVEAHYHPDRNQVESTSVRNAHFIDGDLAAWDAPFFNITAAEADAMDPGQRLTLEAAFRALENAGLPLEKVAGSKTSVYSATFMRDYDHIQNNDPDMQAKYRGIGTTPNMLSNRVSWFFDMRGPSGSVDTACSSSLLALDLVCQSIWSGDADMGLACGNNIMMTPYTTVSLDNLGLLGKDGRCFSFDHRGNGYARGEGVGVVVVKPVDAALRDGDTIRAVIRSTCSNQDGKTPTISQPSREAQLVLIRDAYAKANLDLGATRYFEAHGTGTPVGDPIETSSIGAAFRTYRSPQDPLYVGSVKSNIGHLEGAAGVAGVIKAVIALEAGMIPPQTNFEKLNSAIDAHFLNIKIPTEATPWPTNGLRRASIQSFGIGGANSHVVLDDAYNFLRQRGLAGHHNTVPIPPRRAQDIHEVLIDSPFRHRLLNGTNGTNGTHHAPLPTELGAQLLVWSTYDDAGMKRVIPLWKDYLSKLPSQIPDHAISQYVQDLAYTLATRRTHFTHRAFTVTEAQTATEAVETADKISSAMKAHPSPKLGFVFSGQGSQWFAMGRELSFRYPVYRNSVLAASVFLRGLGCPWDAMEELSREEKDTNVNNAEFSQPLCTIIQVALVDLLESFGIRPSTVVGHSSGEIAAAYSAGALSKYAAWKIAYFRGLLASKLTAPGTKSKVNGAMMAVGLSAVEAKPYLQQVAKDLGSERLVVACVNSPLNVTISGESSHIDHLKTLLDSAPGGAVFARKLKVEVAYHSFQMLEVADEYLARAGQLDVPKKMGRLPTMVSSVTGTWIQRHELANPQYWVRNLVSPVLFSDALSVMCAAAGSTAQAKPNKLDGSHARAVPLTELIEIGPHSVMQGPSREILKSIGKESNIRYLSALIRKQSAIKTVLDLAGRLHCLGYTVNLPEVNTFLLPGAKLSLKSLTTNKVLATLPEYPFNHSKTYWVESRLSKAYRFRRDNRHELVGAQAFDWNPLEARWRHFIRLSDMPWVEHHKINGTTLYPAAGMLVMAIEAVKQLSDPEKELTGFLFRDVTFHSALSIPDNSSEAVEVNLHLRPRKDAGEKDAGWHDFRLYKYNGADWQENCNGSIQLVYSDSDSSTSDELNTTKELAAWKSSRLSLVNSTREACKSKADPAALYEQLAASGYNYGPTFQGIRDLVYNNDAMVASVQTYRWARHFEGPYDPTSIMPHTVHPTTLDTILHTMLAVYTRGGTQKIATTIPTFVDRMWLSAKPGALSAPVTDSVTVCTSGRSSGLRESESSIVVLDSSSQEVLIDVEGFQTTAVSGSSSSSSEEGENQKAKPCYTVDWKPDLTLLSGPDLASFCHDSIPDPGPEPIEWSQELDLFLLSTIKSTVTALQKSGEAERLEGYKKKYYNWMLHRLAHLLPSTASQLDDTALIANLAAKLEKGSKQSRFYWEVAQDHINLLADDKRTLDLFFSGSLVNDYYAEAILAPCTTRIRAVIDAMAHKNPALNLIEIGAGTGSMTEQFMRALNTRVTPEGTEERVHTPRYNKYVYTDLSPSFFSAAREKYAEQGEKLQFKTLDIMKDPAEQGFEGGGYDVVVASGVLHATSDLATTLRNSRKLLKVGGKLIILEPSMGDKGLRMNFAFGLLRDWWLSIEPNRTLTPCLDESGWDTLFHQTGFSGNDVVLHDWQSDACHEFSILMSTATESSPTPTAERKIVIIHGDDAEQQVLAQQLQHTFPSPVATVPLSSALEIPLQDDTLLVFLLELGKPVWNAIEEALFKQLQKILTANLNTKILWVGREGFEGPDSLGAPPAYRLIDGVSRVLNSEVDGEALSVLTLQTELGITREHLQLIIRVTAKLSETQEGLADTEFYQKNGRLCVPRMVRSAALSTSVAKRLASQQTVQRAWKNSEDKEEIPLKLVLGTPGLLNTLHFVQDKERDAVPLGPGEVEIEVRAVGLNYRDVLIALGRLSNANVGCECAGVVVRAGAEVKGLQVGDRVAALAPSGCYRSYLRVDNRFAAPIPDSMPFHIAAAMLVNHLTAWSAFNDLAHVAPGETVLVHSAAGGTGQAALQVAKYLGAEIVATAGSEDKKALLVEKYGVSPEKIFSSRDPDAFARGVKRVTDGRGVDAVLNSLSGEGLKATWECVGPFGRFIEIGKRDIRARKNLAMSRFEENLSFHAFDVGIVCKFRPNTIRPTLQKLFGLYEEGVFQPAYPLQTYGVSELEKAFRIMQSGKTMGKIVVEMHPDAEVEAVLDTRPSTVIGPNASYVIAGGLGGLGRSMATWLVDRGARNLILLSRSGAKSEQAKDFIRRLEERGVRVAAPVCDVSDANALRSVLDDCGRTMPPVRGAIQATMVLRDATFAGMTYENWKAATVPKVQGSWNMHALLPQDMDFFVGLSSAAGVAGGRGQANYAAGNTFIDALMQHRVSRGQSGSTLDLGVFFNVGFMLESADLQARWKGREHLAVTEADLFALLDGYCAPQEAKKIPFQAAVGIAGFVGDKSSEYYFRKPMLQTLVLEDDSKGDDDAAGGQQSAKRVDFASVFAKSTSLAEAAAAVNDAMLSKLAATLSLSREELDANTPLHTYGVDSLVAVELRNWFAKEVHADLAIFDILGGATTTTASALAAAKTRLKKGDWGESSA